MLFGEPSVPRLNRKGQASAARLVDSTAEKHDSRLSSEPAPMRFTKTVPVIAAALLLAACATTGTSGQATPLAARTPAEAHAACEATIYRTPAPDDAAALDCAHRLDLWP